MDSFINLWFRSADAGDQNGLRVPSERVLQQSCQLAVSIWHIPVCVLVAQLVDHLAKSEERLINIAAFGKSQAYSIDVTFVVCHFDSFATCKIDEADLRGESG